MVPDLTYMTYEVDPICRLLRHLDELDVFAHHGMSRAKKSMPMSL